MWWRVLSLVVLASLLAGFTPHQQGIMAVTARRNAGCTAPVELAQGSSNSADTEVATLTTQDVDSTGTNRYVHVALSCSAHGSGADCVSASCTYNSQSLTQVGSTLTEGDARLWNFAAAGLNSCTGATCDTVCSWTGDAKAGMTVRTYTGVDQSTPIGSNVTAQATSDGPATATATGADSTTLIIDTAVRWSNAQTPTVGADQTEDVNANTGGGSSNHFYLASNQAGSAGGVMSWSWTPTPTRPWIIRAMRLDCAN